MELSLNVETAAPLDSLTKNFAELGTLRISLPLCNISISHVFMFFNAIISRKTNKKLHQSKFCTYLVLLTASEFLIFFPISGIVSCLSSHTFPVEKFPQSNQPSKLPFFR